MKDPELSIVIVSYNVRSLLIRCVETVMHNIGHDIRYEMIIVDNASNDNTAEEIKLIFPDVTLIANDHNAGFPAANNQGFAVSSGKYILMLNPDTEIVDDSVQKLLSYYKTLDHAGVIGPALMNPDKSIQSTIWRFPKVIYVIADLLYLPSLIPRKYYKDKDRASVIEVDSLAGAAMLFSRDLLNNIGNLNEKLFWIEDVDFCYRAQKAGFTNFYFPEAKVIHHIGQSAKKNYDLSIYFQTVNKVNFYKVHGSLMNVIILWIVSFINVIIRMFVLLLLSPFKHLYYLKAKAYFYTLKRFLGF